MKRNLTLAALAAMSLTLLLPTVAADPITLFYRCPAYDPDSMTNSCVWIGLDDEGVTLYQIGTAPARKCVDPELCVEYTTVQITESGTLPAFIPASNGSIELTALCFDASADMESRPIICPTLVWDTGDLIPERDALRQLDDWVNPVLA